MLESLRSWPTVEVGRFRKLALLPSSFIFRFSIITILFISKDTSICFDILMMVQLGMWFSMI